ncbi:MAG: CoA transferase, partial [Chloroflexi bacterium]|nr:CoA transferase [Chloroflexota bacterium]
VEYARKNISARFRSDTTANWIAKLDAAGAPASQVNLPEDMFDDPQVQAIGAIAEIEHPLTGPEQLVGPVYRMSDSPPVPSGPSPIFDADTDDILREHGYQGAEIAALRRSGAVGVDTAG